MRLKTSFHSKAVVFVALLSLFIAGCASSGGTSSGGIKTDVGVDTATKTINLGILTPLSNSAKVIGIPLTRGIEVFFKDINDNGGIDGYKVNLIEKDNNYPDTQQQTVQYDAIHTQVLMIAESLGTPTTFAIKDRADKDNMLVGAATLSSALARETHLILLGQPVPQDERSTYRLT